MPGGRRSTRMAARKKEEKLTIEQMLEELEAITNALGEEELPLEEAFLKYQKGMELLKECSQMIDHVEKELQILEDAE